MKNIALILVAIAIISVFSAVATFYIIGQKIAQEDRGFLLEQELWELEKNRVVNALINVVDAQDIIKGFWLEYTSDTGEIELVLVSVDDLAAQRLSASELSKVTDDIRDGRIIVSDRVTRISEEELPENLQFHNGIYASLSGGTSTKDMQEILEMNIDTKDSSSAVSSSLAYLYELQGDYTARDMVYKDTKDICESCREQVTVTIKGMVVDLKGEPVQGVIIDVLGTNEKTVRTDSTGSYIITAPAFVPGKLRVSALKRNFSDGVVSVNTISKDKTVYIADPIVIAGAVSVVTIDTKNKTVSGNNNQIRSDNIFVVRTDRSIYEIPSNALIYENGTPYQGEADIYLYEFSQGNIPDGLIQVDTFDEVRGFAGDLMKTFGMPFIQFFSVDGEELHISSDNPMVLTYKIPNMDSLRENTLAIYSPLTDEDMQFLVRSSLNSKEKYPIDRDFLISNQLLKFPAFWVFDRRAGVWNSVGISVLDIEGTIKSEFYTIKD